MRIAGYAPWYTCFLLSVPLVWASPAWAACSAINGVTTCQVGNASDLAAAISSVNSDGSSVNVIEFTADISLSSPLAPITSAGTVFIKGNDRVLSGDGNESLLHIGDAGGGNTFVQIGDLTLKNGVATTSGGALYVDASGQVVLKNVAMDGNQAATNGGAIYVASGGSLNINGDSVVKGGSATAGSGLFLDGSGMLTLNVSAGKQLALQDDISDTGGAPGAWSLYVKGDGGAPVDTSDPTAGRDYGLVQLNGTNTYTGGTLIQGADVGVGSMSALGSSGAVTLDDGGLVVADGMDISRDFVLLSDSRVGVASGQATLKNNITGSDDLIKVGAGDLRLELLPGSTFTGDWIVREGGLLLDSDSRLGSSNLTLDGGGVGFLGDFGLRSFAVTSRGGYVDNRGNDVSVSSGLLGPVSGWLKDVTLTFKGTGTTTLAEGGVAALGSTVVEAGTVVGNIAQGELTVNQGATYDVNGKNRQISALRDGTVGGGSVDMGAQTLTVRLDYDNSGSQQGGAGGIGGLFPGGSSGSGSGSTTAPSFSGTITGSGSLVIANSDGLSSAWNQAVPPDMDDFRTQEITGTSSGSWSTNVFAGALLHVTSAASLGSGALTLQNGALQSGQDFTKDISLAGDVGIFQTTQDIVFSGKLSGSADFLKTGDGTLTLTGDNSALTGDMVVTGDTSRIAASAANQLGSGDLVLVNGGGLTLLGDINNYTQQLQLASGIGSLDTNGHDMNVSGDVSGIGLLNKLGSGSLILTGNVNSALSVGAGNVQLGDGDHGGSVNAAIDIAGGAQLVVNRNDSLAGLTLNQPITGAGEVVKQGSGLLQLVGSNDFSGGLTVNAGYVSGDSDAAYGSATILLDGGGLQLASDLSRDVELGANNGSLQVATGDSYHFSGQLTGTGALAKTGAGTLIYTGLGSQSMVLQVDDGTFQVGEGQLGALLGNVSVASGATLAFARDDLTQYDGVIDGSGEVVKNGSGELVLTGDQLFTGDLHIATGSVRLGYSGTSGSLAGGAELDAGTELLVDRTGTATIGGSLTGSGTLRNVGTAQLALPGDSSAFAGSTQVENGSLRVDGILGGDASLAYGTWLQGTGSILGNLTFTDGAEFRPGNSIGTFNVGGDLTFDSGSQLTIELDDAGHSDKVAVTGKADLAGVLQLKPQTGTYATGCCTYTILNAGGGLNGSQFDQVLNDLAFLTASVQYQPDSVVVTLARNGGGNNPGGNGFTLTGLTWNQRQVQTGLNALDPSDPLVAQVMPLSKEEAEAAYNNLSGDVYLNQADAAADISRHFGRLLASRTSRLGLASRGGSQFALQEQMAQVRAGQLPEVASLLNASQLNSSSLNSSSFNYNGPTSTLEGGWVQVSPVLLTQDDDADVGSAASSLKGTLLSLGADGHWTDELIGGIGLGYLQGDLDYDNRASSGDLNGVLAGLYARWENPSSGWQYKGALTLGSFDTSMKRSVTVGAGTYLTRASGKLKTVGVDGELGYAWLRGSYAIRPYLMANLQYLKRDALSEGGSTPADLEMDAASNKLGEAGIGVELSRPWLTDGRRWAQLQGGVALVMPFGDTQLAQATHFGATVPTYTVKATPNDQPALQLTFGGEWYFTPKLSFWGGYAGRISNTMQEHNGMISLQYRW